MTAQNDRQTGFHDAALLMQFPDLAGWRPTVSDVEAQIDQRTASMLAAIFDQPPCRNGDVLPPAWHWAFFIEPALQRDVGADGHPKKGGFLPPISFPRRAFAGSRFRFVQPLIVGNTYRKTATVSSINVKQGSSGKLAFVGVKHEVLDVRGKTCMTEEQEIVYRELGGVAKSPAPPETKTLQDVKTSRDIKTWTWTQDVVADPVMLFRYSAVTFNSHRIHYDRPYATQQEGHSDLVVHGPLLATLMLELLRAKLPLGRILDFQFSAKRMVFARSTFQVAGKVAADCGAVELAILSGGQIAMAGQATLRLSSGEEMT